MFTRIFEGEREGCSFSFSDDIQIDIQRGMKEDLIEILKMIFL